MSVITVNVEHPQTLLDRITHATMHEPWIVWLNGPMPGIPYLNRWVILHFVSGFLMHRVGFTFIQALAAHTVFEWFEIVAGGPTMDYDEWMDTGADTVFAIAGYAVARGVLGK